MATLDPVCRCRTAACSHLDNESCETCGCPTPNTGARSAATDDGVTLKRRRIEISVDGTTVVAIDVDEHSAELSSTILDEQEAETLAEEDLGVKKTIAALIFDHDYDGTRNETRPTEDTCNALAEQIQDNYVSHPYAIAVETVESLLLSMACEGIDLSDPAFGRALDTTLHTMAERL